MEMNGFKKQGDFFVSTLTIGFLYYYYYF